jgi:hypothetical protein
MEQWYYAQGREKCGPIDRSQLIEFLKTGVITPGSLVWTNTMSEWKPAIQVPGLLGGDPEPAAAPAIAAAPEPAPAAAPAATATSATVHADLPPGATSWEQLEASSDTGMTPGTPPPDAGASGTEVPAAAATDQNPAPNATESPAGGLTFSAKRKKPTHLRPLAKIKKAIGRVAALLIALAILGGGGYYGAQYLGMLDEPVPPRLRYMPDNPDFVFSLNVPKLLSISQSISAEAGSIDSNTLINSVSIPGLPIDPASVQDITVAGSAKDKSWVIVATLSKPIEVDALFPGGKQPEMVRAGGTKIYYNREMASYGLDFALALPTKSTLVVGPFEELKKVLKRRGAPTIPSGFMPLLEAENSEAWMAAAANVDALWSAGGDSLPVNLTDEQRWLVQSISSVSMTVVGNSEFDASVTAQCKNPKDAPLLVSKLKQVLAEQRKAVLKELNSYGQAVDADTKTPFDDVEIVANPNGMITMKQHVDKEMMRLGSHQLAAAGLVEP